MTLERDPDHTRNNVTSESIGTITVIARRSTFVFSCFEDCGDFYNELAVF